MHSIKKWMCQNDWFKENKNFELKEFIQNKFLIEEPVYLNNIGNALQIDLTSFSTKKKISFAVQIFTELLGDFDFFFCEYGAIGLSDRKRYIIGKPNKINCIEYQTTNPDIEYLYNNISYVRVCRKHFKFQRYVRDVICKKCFSNLYYFIDLDRQIALRMYDDRGIDVVCNKELLKLLYKKYNDLISEQYREEIKKSIYN